jgi:hypothetical protein
MVADLAANCQALLESGDRLGELSLVAMHDAEVVEAGTCTLVVSQLAADAEGGV